MTEMTRSPRRVALFAGPYTYSRFVAIVLCFAWALEVLSFAILILGFVLLSFGTSLSSLITTFTAAIGLLGMITLIFGAACQATGAKPKVPPYIRHLVRSPRLYVELVIFAVLLETGYFALAFSLKPDQTAVGALELPTHFWPVAVVFAVISTGLFEAVLACGQFMCAQVRGWAKPPFVDWTSAMFRAQLAGPQGFGRWDDPVETRMDHDTARAHASMARERALSAAYYGQIVGVVAAAALGAGLSWLISDGGKVFWVAAILLFVSLCLAAAASITILQVVPQWSARATLYEEYADGPSHPGKLRSIFFGVAHYLRLGNARKQNERR